MGHIAKFCLARREEYKRKQKRLHAHVVEDEEPPTKMMREEIKDHVLILALSGSITPGEDTWLIDSGASKHMTGQRNILSCISEKKFSQKVTLGDDYQYPIKGVGESNHKLNSGNSLKMKDVLYEEEPTLHFSFREERLQSCLIRWRSSYVGQRRNLK
jgi:hypothetical protein